MKKFFLIFILFLSVSSLSSTLSLDTNAINLNSVTIKKGMMEINLQNGKAIKLKLSNLEIGFLYIGEGNWISKVEEKYALQVLKYNLKNGSHLSLDGNTIKNNFKSAMIFGIEALNNFKGEEIPKDLKFEEELKRYEREIFDQKLPSPHFYVLNGIINNFDIFGAIFEGGSDEIIYIYDPFWRKEENLYALKDSGFKRKGKANIKFENLIVNQTIERKREETFLSPITLKKIDYEIDFTNLSNILANFKLEFFVNYGEFSSIPLNLPNSEYYFRSGGYWFAEFDDWIISGGGADIIEQKFLFIDSIKLWDGKEIPYFHNGDILTLFFPNKFKKGDLIRINILYGGNIFEPTTDMSYYVNLSGLSWFPNPLQGYDSVNCLFSGKIKCKKPFYPFASFDIFNTKEENEILTLEGKAIYPENYHSIAVGKYFTKSKKILNKFDITVASAVFPNERAYETFFGLSEGIFDFYEYLLKGYPYKHLNIIEGRGTGWGHAPAGIVYVSAEVYNPYFHYSSVGSNQLFAHEVAHQYFGHLIRIGKFEDRWLEEALAEYISAFWWGRAKGEREFKYIYSYWYKNAKEANDKASIFARGLLSGENSGRYYWALTYCKGPVLIHSIRKKVGDQIFFTLLRSFLRSFEHKQVITSDFIGLLEFLTKESWKDFFDKYLYGMEMPEKEKN